jgi:hypothetical protein
MLMPSCLCSSMKESMTEDHSCSAFSVLAFFLRGWSCQRLSLGRDLLAICVQVCS